MEKKISMYVKLEPETVEQMKVIKLKLGTPYSKQIEMAIKILTPTLIKTNE